jgi:hypothetical protein
MYLIRKAIVMNGIGDDSWFIHMWTHTTHNVSQFLTTFHQPTLN